MTLLAPLFLVGLLGLSIPVIIHLVHRQKPEGKPFPSLMFLRKIPHKAQRRQKIRHWLIFLLRCAAIVLVVLAFSRPLFQRSPEALAQLVGGRDIVMLLDRSLSMAYGDRWGRAVAAAQNTIDGMGPEDRMAIVAFDVEATALSEPTADPLELSAALRTVTRGAAGTRYSPALKLAQNLLAQGEQPRQDVVIISDFQRSGWDRQDVIRLPDHVRLTTVDLSDPRPANVAVSSVQLRQEPRGDREDAIVSARIVNTGMDDVTELPVTLELNGQDIQTLLASVSAGSSELVVFEPALVPLGQSRGVVRIAPDGLVEDNAFHFVLSPGQAIRVLVIEGSSPRANQSLYLQRALEVGTDPAFRVTVRPLRNLRLSDLDDAQVVIANDAPIPGGTAGARLRELVEGGGGLLVVLGTSSVEGAGDGLIPGTVGPRVEPRSERGAAIASIDYGHPVFEPFSGPRSGDFAAARIFRYRAVNVLPEDDAAVLARFDDGAVAVAERAVGEGRVLVLATTTDTYWNDLALQPVFLPFVHGVAKHLAHYGTARPWFDVGAVADLVGYSKRVEDGEAVVAALTDVANGEAVVVTPAGERERVGATGQPLFKIAESGFYEIQPDYGSETRIVFAANVDPAESDLTPVDLAEFTTSLSSVTDADVTAGTAGALSLDDQERRQSVWWYLLLTAVVIFTVETLLSNRLSRAVRP